MPPKKQINKVNDDMSKIKEILKQANNNDSDDEIRKPIKKPMSKKYISSSESETESEIESETENEIEESSELELEEINDKKDNIVYVDLTFDDFSEKEMKKIINSNNDELMSKYFNKHIYNSKDTFELDDKLWIKEGKYQKYNGEIQINYKVNEDVIRIMRLFGELKAKIKNYTYCDPNEGKKEHIYKIINYSDDTITLSPSSTKISSSVSFKSTLYFALNTDKSTTFSKFQDLQKVKSSVVAIYKGEYTDKEIKEIKLKYDCNNTVNGNKDIINTYDTKLKKIIDKMDLTNILKRKFYIYKIFSKINVTKQYIYGSFNICKHSDIKKVFNSKLIDFDGESYDFDDIETYECQFEYQAMLRIDYYIKKNNTLKYNKCYNALITNVNKDDDIKNYINIQVQKELIIMNIKNDIKIEENMGYIGCIEINDKKYIFNETHMNLKEKIEELYETSLEYAYNNQKILKELHITNYKNIKIYVLEKDISINRLNIIYHRYLKSCENVEYNEVQKNVMKQIYGFKNMWNKK